MTNAVSNKKPDLKVVDPKQPEQPTPEQPVDPQAGQSVGDPINPELPAPSFDDEGQASIPGTEQENPAKEPRGRGDIEHDFRMATFYGQIKKITEDWSAGRKLNLSIETGDRIRLAHGLDKFSAADELVFRVLPKQPLLGDEEPEEFGTKVPRFCVDMVERLERKSAQGVKGWQDLTVGEIYDRLDAIMAELKAAVADLEGGAKGIDCQATMKAAVDLADYAFFLWWTENIEWRRNKVVD